MKPLTSQYPALFCVPTICTKSKSSLCFRTLKQNLHDNARTLSKQHEYIMLNQKKWHAICIFSMKNAENNHVTWVKLLICVPVIMNLQNNEEIPHPSNLTSTQFELMQGCFESRQLLCSHKIIIFIQFLVSRHKCCLNRESLNISLYCQSLLM